MWEPYEICKEGSDTAVNRLRLLEKGDINYRADDRLTCENRTAINCFDAMASLNDLFRQGREGFNIWGINGTNRGLIEHNERATIKGG